MAIYVGSARIDEKGNARGGVAGDQKQTNSVNDTAGEVSMQKMYTNSKGWYIIRPKSISHANNLAERMIAACNNIHLGYDQNQRLGVITSRIDSTIDTECDCSSLVRECIIEACGVDPGNFRTVNQPTYLKKCGLFLEKISYVSQTKTPVYDGDILVTKTSGHTVIVVSGNPRPAICVPMVTIRKGDKGDAVVCLQYCLNLCGACLDVDGDFGKKTDAALRSWQSTYELVSDGIYGAKSSAKMAGLIYM